MASFYSFQQYENPTLATHNTQDNVTVLSAETTDLETADIIWKIWQKLAKKAGKHVIKKQFTHTAVAAFGSSDNIYVAVAFCKRQFRRRGHR